MSDASHFGTFGRHTEVPLDQLDPQQLDAFNLSIKERGQVPGPYKIWLQNPKLMTVMVPLGKHFQGHSSLSKAEIEIATNIVNARWLAAYSNYEHEKIAEKEGGLSAEKVQALIAGRPTSFEDARQEVVYEVASALVTPRVIPTGLYDRAIELLGDVGLTDLTILLGYFSCVSFTLMAYDVPSNAVGLER